CNGNNRDLHSFPTRRSSDLYSGPRFHEEMRDLGLTDLFESTVVSCEIGYMKPHPRIFQYALKSLGAAAEETAMVGDSLHADVEGDRKSTRLNSSHVAISYAV